MNKLVKGELKSDEYDQLQRRPVKKKKIRYMRRRVIFEEDMRNNFEFILKCYKKKKIHARSFIFEHLEKKQPENQFHHTLLSQLIRKQHLKTCVRIRFSLYDFFECHDKILNLTKKTLATRITYQIPSCGLTKTRKLQLSRTLPKSVVELNLIIQVPQHLVAIPNPERSYLNWLYFSSYWFNRLTKIQSAKLWLPQLYLEHIDLKLLNRYLQRIKIRKVTLSPIYVRPTFGLQILDHSEILHSLTTVIASESLVTFGGSVKKFFLDTFGIYIQSLRHVRDLAVLFNCHFPPEQTTFITSLSKMNLLKLHLHIRQFVPSFLSLQSLDGKLKVLKLGFDTVRGSLEIGRITSLEEFDISVLSGRLDCEKQLVQLINGTRKLKKLSIEKLYFESFNLTYLLDGIRPLAKLKSFNLTTIFVKDNLTDLLALKKFVKKNNKLREFSFKQSNVMSFFDPKLIVQISEALEPCLGEIQKFKFDLNRCKEIKEWKLKKSISNIVCKMAKLKELDLIIRYNYFTHVEVKSLFKTFKSLTKLRILKITGKIDNLRDSLKEEIKEFIRNSKRIFEIDVNFGDSSFKEDLIKKRLLSH